MKVTTHKHHDQKLQKQQNFKLKHGILTTGLHCIMSKGTPPDHRSEVCNSEGKEHLESLKKQKNRKEREKK